MKTFAWIAIATLAVSQGCSQDTNGRPWKATVKVVDEAGRPVSDADVTIGYYVPPPEGQTIATSSTKGKTDTNGLFSAAGQTSSVDLLFGAGKEGYYRDRLEYELGAPYQYDPVKWSPTISLLLKRVINPIPMHARKVEGGPPAFNEKVGYDLEAGDWVTPHGTGKSVDVIFFGKLDQKARDDFDYELTISFPNRGDGIQEFAKKTLPPGQGSALRSPHEALAEGYLPKVVRTMTRHPGQGTKDDSDNNRNYFFRVRTVLDEKGNVKSALYGKIYGDFMQFQYYLNPTPNERNVEFNPTRNLLSGLKANVQVSEP